MVDSIDQATRSLVMSRVKGKDTRPEMVVRSLVFAAGYRYRLHVRSLPGSPNLVFSARKKVIFVHGCFWHRHEHCSLRPIADVQDSTKQSFTLNLRG
ncbi:hypothetical protein GTP38_19870 [Duganella sp. FT94W]|uniref:Very short patch repair endonuclease n=2 Tax=Duganella lactea TaxID=2692173 RepID=A0ABW9VAB8_9BURK|nr:hypothetical protein [Duganella lactea]